MRNSVQFLETVAQKLRAEVPGLTCIVRNDLWNGCALLGCVYQCPCGEESQMQHAATGYEPPETARWVADMLKHQLRKHVISEGNTPNF